jgi:hypothetical protein
MPCQPFRNTAIGGAAEAPVAGNRPESGIPVLQFINTAALFAALYAAVLLMRFS